MRNFVEKQSIHNKLLNYSILNLEPSSNPIKSAPELYYWHREEQKSNAEVDFLFLKESSIIPVEVKSGNKGGLKSMHLFLESHPNSPLGLKISENGYGKHLSIQQIPFYGINAWLTV